MRCGLLCGPFFLSDCCVAAFWDGARQDGDPVTDQTMEVLLRQML